MIETQRLILRQWSADDIPAFTQLNACPDTMEFFPSVYSQEQTQELVDWCSASIAERGWGFWAVEEKVSSDFIGMVGLNDFPRDIPVKQSHEVGWRLLRTYWGKGYATEAAKASLSYGFNKLGLDEIVAFTPTGNVRSRKVMDRLGMTLEPDTFEHPRVPADFEHSTHVLYTIARSSYEQAL